MATTTTADPAVDLAPEGGGRRADRVFWLLALGGGLLVLAILALILLTTLREAWPVIGSAQVVDLITSAQWDPNLPIFGALAFVFGTAVVSVISLIFAVPISLGIALFLTELAPRRLRTPVNSLIDLLAAVPSVVYGLWGILVLAPALVPVYQSLHNLLGGIPVIGAVFGPPVSSGRSFMTAGLILAIMIIPIITSISREVLSTVPDGHKQAAYALGATRWEMIKGAIIPFSFGGLVGAVMLGLGRAMGETIAVALTIGAATQVTANVFDAGNALPAVIVQQFGESTGDFTAALFALGVLLFALTVIVNLIARMIVRHAERRMTGAA